MIFPDVFLTSGPSVSDASVLAGPAIINLGARNAMVELSGAAASGIASGSQSADGASSTMPAKSGASSVAKVSGVATLFAAAFALLI